MKRLLKFKYPKIAWLIFFIALAYVIFKNSSVGNFISHLGMLSYLGVFLAGIFFAFGFTAPFAAGFFITLNPQNILLMGIIGGLGAMISDLLIFKFIRVSFEDEFKNIEKEKISKNIEKIIDYRFGNKLRIYLMYIFAGILIASPLPDEIGVIMLSGLTKINVKMLSILGFILNTLGILILLYI